MGRLDELKKIVLVATWLWLTSATLSANDTIKSWVQKVMEIDKECMPKYDFNKNWKIDEWREKYVCNLSQENEKWKKEIEEWKENIKKQKKYLAQLDTDIENLKKELKEIELKLENNKKWSLKNKEDRERKRDRLKKKIKQIEENTVQYG